MWTGILCLESGLPAGEYEDGVWSSIWKRSWALAGVGSRYRHLSPRARGLAEECLLAIRSLVMAP